MAIRTLQLTYVVPILLNKDCCTLTYYSAPRLRKGLWGRRVPHTAGYFNTILPFVISLDILLLVAEKFRK
jgi:hypothetical protein